MPSPFTPDRVAPNSKLEFGRLVQLHDFALSLGGFVVLSGWICFKTQMNHEVQVDSKSKRQRVIEGPRSMEKHIELAGVP